MNLSLTFDIKGVIQYMVFVLMSVCMCVCVCVAPLSMGFPRQEYWNGLQFPSPGDLPDPGMESASPALQVDSLLLSHLGSYFNLKKLEKEKKIRIV